MAHLVQEYLDLHRVLFIPTKNHAFQKESLQTSFAHRCNLVAAAIKEYPSFELWDKEGARAGVSYSVDTICEIREERMPQEIFFIIGSDNLSNFPRWRSYEKILKLAHLAVVERPGYAMSTPQHLPVQKIHSVPSPFWGISSTTLRTYCAQGYTCTGLLHPAVQKYIKQHNLYSGVPS